jgi:Phospholipase_D-nuclease N-terminal
MTLVGYTYPLLNIVWTMLIFFALVAWFVFLISCLVDNFRRTDHHGWAKAGWLILIMFLPVLGVIFYVATRPATPATI